MIITGTRCIIDKFSPEYPARLLETTHPTTTLYCIGDTSLLSQTGFSIVGTRRSTPYGNGCAARFAKLCVESGVTLVNGGAAGIESYALDAAVKAGGKCIVVQACGLNVPYPKSNTRLFQAIVDAGGLLVSAYHWDEPPIPYHFRARNGITAALSSGILVVECGLPSGVFSMAETAIDSGCSAYAIPGAITAVQSRGSNELIALGAGVVIDDTSFTAALKSCGFDVDDGIDRF